MSKDKGLTLSLSDDKLSALEKALSFFAKDVCKLIAEYYLPLASVQQLNLINWTPPGPDPWLESDDSVGVAMEIEEEEKNDPDFADQLKSIFLKPDRTIDITHLSWAGMIVEKKFYKAILNYLDMPGAIIKSDSFTGCLLNEANFEKATFTYCRIRSCELKKANFTKATLAGKLESIQELKKAKFDDAQFFHFIFDNVNFSEVSLKRVKLTGDNIIFRNLRFNGGDFSEVDFSASPLCLEGIAFLTNANFTKAKFNKMTLVNKDFGESDLTEAELAYTDLRSTRFTHCILKAADLSGADILGTHFDKAHLYQTDFSKAKNAVGAVFSSDEEKKAIDPFDIMKEEIANYFQTTKDKHDKKRALKLLGSLAPDQKTNKLDTTLLTHFIASGRVSEIDTGTNFGLITVFGHFKSDINQPTSLLGRLSKRLESCEAMSTSPECADIQKALAKARPGAKAHTATSSLS